MVSMCCSQGSSRLGASYIGRVLTGQHNCLLYTEDSRVLLSELVLNMAVEVHTGLQGPGDVFLVCLRCVFMAQ